MGWPPRCATSLQRVKYCQARRCCGFNAFHMDSLGVAERLSDKIATCHGDGLRGWFMALFYPQKNLNYSSLQLIHVHYVMFPVIAPECCAATCFNILQDLHDLTVSLKAQAARCRIQRWDAWTYFHGWSENQSLTTLYNLRWLHTCCQVGRLVLAVAGLSQGLC